MLDSQPQQGSPVVPDLQAGEFAVLRSLDRMCEREQGWATPAELAASAGLNLRSTMSALRELHRRELAQARRGRWALNPSGVPLLSYHDLKLIQDGRR
jgi:hypothetical protein